MFETPDEKVVIKFKKCASAFSPEEVRKVVLNAADETTMNIDELIFMCQRIFDLTPTKHISLKYIDGDGDLVTLKDNSDLVFALIDSKRYLKLHIYEDCAKKVSVQNDKVTMSYQYLKEMNAEMKSMMNKLSSWVDQLDSLQTEERKEEKGNSNSTHLNSETKPAESNVKSGAGKEFDPLQNSFKETEQQHYDSGERSKRSNNSSEGKPNVIGDNQVNDLSLSSTANFSSVPSMSSSSNDVISAPPKTTTPNALNAPSINVSNTAATAASKNNDRSNVFSATNSTSGGAGMPPVSFGAAPPSVPSSSSSGGFKPNVYPPAPPPSAMSMSAPSDRSNNLDGYEVESEERAQAKDGNARSDNVANDGNLLNKHQYGPQHQFNNMPPPPPSSKPNEGPGNSTFPFMPSNSSAGPGSNTMMTTKMSNSPLFDRPASNQNFAPGNYPPPPPGMYGPPGGQPSLPGSGPPPPQQVPSSTESRSSPVYNGFGGGHPPPNPNVGSYSGPPPPQETGPQMSSGSSGVPHPPTMTGPPSSMNIPRGVMMYPGAKYQTPAGFRPSSTPLQTPSGDSNLYNPMTSSQNPISSSNMSPFMPPTNYNAPRGSSGMPPPPNSGYGPPPSPHSSMMRPPSMMMNPMNMGGGGGFGGQQHPQQQHYPPPPPGAPNMSTTSSLGGPPPMPPPTFSAPQ